MQDKRKWSPVFVIGFPRSGTTLLKRLIESHSSFAVAQKDNPDGSMFYTPETHLFNLVYQYKLAADTWNENVTRFFNNPEAFIRFQNSVKYILFFQNYFLSKIFRYRYFTTILNRVDSKAIRHSLRLWYYVNSMNKAVVDRYFYHAAVARGSKRILEKTPYHYEFVSEILYSFSAANIVFISRHPVDVYSSFRKRLRIDKTWPDVSLSTFCQDYRNCYESILWHLKRRPNNLISMQYEELVHHPEEAFEAVCAFIGEEFESSCLLGDKSLKGPEWDPHVHKDIVKQTKSWGDYISREDAEEIEIRLEDLISIFRYAYYTQNH